MLTELQKHKVKSWAKEAYRIICESSKDTTPRRIWQNRERLLPSFIEREDVDVIKEALDSPTAYQYMKELVRLLYEYEHYFDKGYRSPENIDDLPDKLKRMLARVIKADI